MKNRFQYFFMLTFSTLLIAAGTYFFKFTNNFTFGGITGLAVLVAKTGAISAGDFNLIMSMIGHPRKRICRKNRILQHPPFCRPLGDGTVFPDGRPVYRPAYAGALLCHCASGAGFRHSL